MKNGDAFFSLEIKKFRSKHDSCRSCVIRFELGSYFCCNVFFRFPDFNNTGFFLRLSGRKNSLLWRVDINGLPFFRSSFFVEGLIWGKSISNISLLCNSIGLASRRNFRPPIGLIAHSAQWPSSPWAVGFFWNEKFMRSEWYSWPHFFLLAAVFGPTTYVPR